MAIGGEKSRVRSNSPTVVLGWNSGATRVGVMREELGKLPGGRAELMWAFARAGVQQGGRSMAEQEAQCGGARWPVVLGVRVAAVRL
jgi:hypothetical protein